jgi:hypothetical protein
MSSVVRPYAALCLHPAHGDPYLTLRASHAVYISQADYETAKAAAAPAGAAAIAADAAAASVAAVGLVEHGSPSPDRNGKDEVRLCRGGGGEVCGQRDVMDGPCQCKAYSVD